MGMIKMTDRLRCAICGKFVTGEYGRVITPDSDYSCEVIEYYCKECNETISGEYGREITPDSDYSREAIEYYSKECNKTISGENHDYNTSG